MLPASVRIFVCTAPQDMRRSFDTLALTAQQVVGEDPQAGSLFVFLGRRANRIKMRLSRKDATTSDADIVRRRFLPIDIDPVRPSGVSGTDAEHGLALLLETERGAVLFDTGATPTVLAANAAALDIDLARVTAVVLSHGHYDHTGGLPAVLAAAPSARVEIASVLGAQSVEPLCGMASGMRAARCGVRMRG